MKALVERSNVNSGLIAIAIVAGALLTGVAMISSALTGNLLPLAGLYILFFTALAWKHRTAAMFFIYGSALFPFDIGGQGLAIGIGEIHLAFIALLVLFDFVIHRWPLPRNPIYIPVICYFAVCIISTVANPYLGTTSPISLVQMFLYFIVTTAVFSNFVHRTDQHMKVLPGVLVGGVFLSLGVLISNNNYFMGMHKNAIGGALSYALIVGAELWIAMPDYRKRALLGLVLMILILGLFRSLSRGSWLCGITGVLFIIFLRGQLGLIVRGLAVVTPIVVTSWFFLTDFERKYIFGFSRSSQNIDDRFKSLDRAQALWLVHPLYGVGVGWRKLYDATNVVWLTLAETGILGLVGFILIHLTLFIMIIDGRRRISMRDPRFSMLAIGGALVFGKFVHGCVDQYWSRGSLLVVFGGVGMAIAAYYSILNEDRAKKELAEKANA